VDPEARPSADQAFQALSAVATGSPLPPYNLSAEALQRRQEREEAAKKREIKTAAKKQVAPVIPQRAAPAQLDANSVAARRLAAKKGIVLPPAPPVSTSKPPIAPSQIPMSAQVSPPVQAFPPLDSFSSQASFDASFADFDAFASPPPLSTSMPTSNSLVDMSGFSQSNDFFSPSSTTATATAPVSADMFFDDDDQTPPPVATTTSSKSIQPFDGSFPVSFDSLSLVDFQPTTSSVSTSSKTSPTASSQSWANDFTPSPAIVQITPAKLPSQAVPDLLDDVSISTTSSFTMSSEPSHSLSFNDARGNMNYREKYGSSAADVMQMFDSPSKSYGTSYGMQQASPRQSYPPASSAISAMAPGPSGIITSTNPAYGRTYSMGPPPINPFASHSALDPSMSLSRSMSLGASSISMGAPSYQHTSSRGAMTPPDPFQMNNLNAYHR
jgi:hypothetical protein